MTKLLPTKPPANDAESFSLLSFAAFLIVVALFLFVSTKAGTRAIGVMMLLSAARQKLTGRIAYGWKGRPPSGYITGFPATILNVLLALIGLAIVLWPEAAATILGWKQK